MVKLRPSWLPQSKVCQAVPICMDVPGFVCHPSTSELASQLMIDPQALSNENYSGLYDENGDYVPQYCDDPEKIPQGGLTANSESTPVGPAPSAGAPGPDSDASADSDATKSD